MRNIISVLVLAIILNLPLIAAPYVPSTPTGISNPNVHAPASTSYTPPYTSSLQPTSTGAPRYSPPAITTPIVPSYSIPMSARRGLITERPRPVSHFEEPTYLFPGLVRFSIDRWIGSDYLYDLPSNIGVVVELIVPQDLSGVFSTDKMRDEVSTIFSNIGIIPMAEAVGERPPLPFFHLVAFIVPSDESYVLSLSGRLFEEVTLPRMNFQLSGTWQGITWEKQEMIVSSKNQLSDQLYGTTKEIAILFAEKVLYFRERRVMQRKELQDKGVVPGNVFKSPFLHPHGACGCD